MINLALVGKSITHSKSPEVYKEILGDTFYYELLDFDTEKKIPSLKDIFNRYNLKGLSITSPYKEHFLKQVSIESEEIKKLGAINCIAKKNNTFFATNTDYPAVQKILRDLLKKNIGQVILLGSGSMANITKNILFNFETNYISFSRNRDGPLENMDLSKVSSSNTLVINSCSREFIFNGKMPKKSLFWDYNYDFVPHNNKFESYLDGKSLLLEQAKGAISFWSLSE